MIQKLRTILEEALHTRRSVTGKRLDDIDFMQLNIEAKTIMIRWLIICRKFNEALSALHSLSPEALPAPLPKEIFAAHMRLWLLHIAPPPSKDTSSFQTRWVTAQQRSNVDIAYPTAIDAIFITLDVRQEVLPVFSIHCPACHNNLEVSLRSDIIPFGATKGTWICPHCLALRDWNADSIKQDCVRQYAAIIQDMPRNAQGKLSDVDSWQAYILAQKLRPLLHITLEGIPSAQQPASPDYVVPHSCLPQQVLLEYIRMSEKGIKHHAGTQGYIRQLTEILQSNPFNESVITELHKLSSTPFYKQFYTSYLQCIREDSIPHLHKKKRQQHDTRPKRITFFSGADNPRILRLAQTAKAAGCIVQIIIQSSAPLEGYDDFDSIIHFDNIFTDLKRITEEIDNFDADCVHAVIQMHVNLLLVALLLVTKVPVIGDAYDMVNIQYKDSAVTHLPYEKRLERLWLASVSGLCMRAPYLGLIKKAGIKMGRIPAATVYDPLIPERCRFPQKLRETDGKIHIMTFGFFRKPEEDTESIQQLLPYLASCNVQVHIIMTRNSDNSIGMMHKEYLQNYDCITYHDKLPYAAYIQLLGSMDMLMECQNTLYCPIERMGYTANTVPFHFPNKNCDCIENDVIRYVPECMLFSKWLCRKAGIAVDNKDTEIYSEKFWKNIVHSPKKTKQEYLQNIVKMAAYTQKKLIKIYNKVIFPPKTISIS